MISCWSEVCSFEPSNAVPTILTLFPMYFGTSAPFILGVHSFSMFVCFVDFFFFFFFFFFFYFLKKKKKIMGNKKKKKKKKNKQKSTKKSTNNHVCNGSIFLLSS